MRNRILFCLAPLILCVGAEAPRWKRYDIDGDSDLDLVIGGDAGSNELWWYENPHPQHDPRTPWKRRFIKKGGGTAHHDHVFGDFDGDGKAELAFWNQNARTLFLSDIPEDPKSATLWPYVEMFSYAKMRVRKKQEGIDIFDVDADGKVDLLAGRYWFKHLGGGKFKPGKHPQIVIAPGDGNGPLRFFECQGDPLDSRAWVNRNLLERDVIHGHSLALADIDGDGQGGFRKTIVSTGSGNHESRIADVNGDGRLDIVQKPYTWDTPRVDVWLNQGSVKKLPLNRWQRHCVDPQLPYRAMYVLGADMNGDGKTDLVVGAWWYENPGFPGGKWKRHTIGEPLRNMAALCDFDGDGDLDLLQGTQWIENPQPRKGSWPTRRGGGPGERHGRSPLSAPGNPKDPWTRKVIGTGVGGGFSMDSADLDADGDVDVVLGEHRGKPENRVIIYENVKDASSWRVHTIDSGPPREVDHHDGTIALDIDGDGDLDIASIGWYNPKLWIYENKAIDRS